MTVKTLERILILRTIINGGGEMAGKDIADRASVECDHDLLDGLPPISRRGIGQKLQAMSMDGLVAHAHRKSSVIAERVSLWSVTAKGRELAAAIGAVAEPPDDGSRGIPDGASGGRAVPEWLDDLPCITFDNQGWVSLPALLDLLAARGDLEQVLREALAALSAKDATNYERVQAAGLILSGVVTTERRAEWTDGAVADLTALLDEHTRPIV